jgi:uncharacterized protein (TIGR00251 family)
MTTPPWIITGDAAIDLLLHMQPGAKLTKVVGIHDGRLKISLQAIAADNKANLALMSFLSHTLGISKDKLLLIQGQSSRQKRVRVFGITVAKAISALQP